jgi:predicted HicB family RNase H-like nuclease
MTHEMARALCEAGYMSVAEYLRLCAENGWQPQSP